MSETFHILLVEDSDDDALLIEAELRRAGLAFDLHRVQTRAELEHSLTSRWDVILSDYALPGFSGPEALEVVKASGRDIPFIVVSGFVGEDLAVQAMKAGAVDYFRKEVMSRLAPAIRREIAECRVRAHNRALEAELSSRLATEQRLRVEAEAANRVKDEFLAMLSHELRTPLNAVLGRVHLLRHANPVGEARDHALEVIERNALAQVQLVEQLLDISRMAGGQLTLEPTDVDLAAAVDDAVAAQAKLAASQRVSLEVDYTRFPTVHGDRRRLQQIASSLVANAIRFSQPGAVVRVSLGVEAGRARLEVTDEGEGIEAAFIPHLFERFRQADQSTRRPHGGLGLGLAIAHHLATLHGGSLTATSPGRGRGATFTFEVPVAARVAASPPIAAGSGGHPSAAPPQVPRRATLEGVRILVVDDDLDARELLGDLLGGHGAQVRIAGGGPEALALAPVLVPDVVVSDIGMPGMDGYDLIRALRLLPPAAGGNAQAIALTAYATPEDRERALAAGFQAHMAKPVRPTDLVKTITSLIAAS